MRIIGGKIYALRIPFVEAFAHSLKDRNFSDSFVVKLISDDGTIGFGEGVAREYVTGETVETSIEHIKNQLFPVILEQDFPELSTEKDALETLAPIDEILSEADSSGEIIWNAARSAVELALIDCLLKQQKLSLGAILPPHKNLVTYSGVITSGTLEKAIQHAKRFKLFGIKQLKIKIGDGESAARVKAIRETVGEDVSLRVDANGAYSPETLISVIKQLEPFNIESIEQPLPRKLLNETAFIKANSPIPLMADESLVTFEDAENLIEKSAFNYFNLRVSKCGGIFKTLKIAQLAEKHGIRLQLGCQVGETAILSAVGRHIAAHLENVEFVEGSYGNLLLSEDISRNAVNFGHGGRAAVLRGIGFGVEIREELLEKYAVSITGAQASCLPRSSAARTESILVNIQY